MRRRINLFLDDDVARIPHKLSWIELPLVEWTIVRTYKDFVDAVKSNDIYIVSFDHDLGDMSYTEFHRAHNSDKNINYENIQEKTGYDCAKFLAHYCIDHNIPIPEYYVHSLNYMGKRNIVSILENAKRVLNSKSTTPDTAG